MLSPPRLDTMSRKMVPIAVILYKKVKLRVASMSHADKVQLDIYGALAEQERDFISKHTKAALAADDARDRHRGLFQHSLVPYHFGRRAELDRAGHALPVAHRRSGDLPEVDQGDHRARPRQPPLGRYFIGRHLVSGRAAQAVREGCRRKGPHPDLHPAIMCNWNRRRACALARRGVRATSAGPGSRNPPPGGGGLCLS